MSPSPRSNPGDPNREGNPRAARSPSGGLSPSTMAFFVILAIVGAVVALYAMSSPKKRAAEAERQEIEMQPPRVDPFEGLPPEEPPPKKME